MLVFVGLLCATIALAVVFFEESMLFFPTRYPQGFWDIEALRQGSGTRVDDHFFTTDDGVRLHAWWCRPPQDELGTADMVLLWFHGNAGNLSDRADLMLRLARIPAQVFIVDYRGYGRSEGKPTEQGLYRDAVAAWRYLLDDRRVMPSKIIIFGISLGGAVAVDLATRVSPAGLIVESSFTSVPDMAAHHYRIVPRALIRIRMDSLAKIPRITAPKLHIHSQSDEIVPIELGRRLYEAAPRPKRFHEIAGAGHNETYIVGGAGYFEAIRSFVEECQTRAH
jgi:pimeloyl-ACP methyl ester carboxylesterase